MSTSSQLKNILDLRVPVFFVFLVGWLAMLIFDFDAVGETTSLSFGRELDFFRKFRLGFIFLLATNALSIWKLKIKP